MKVLCRWLCPDCGKLLAVYLDRGESESLRCPVCRRMMIYERTSRRMDVLKIFKNSHE